MLRYDCAAKLLRQSFCQLVPIIHVRFDSAPAKYSLCPPNRSPRCLFGVTVATCARHYPPSHVAAEEASDFRGPARHSIEIAHSLLISGAASVCNGSKADIRAKAQAEVISTDCRATFGLSLFSRLPQWRGFR